MNMSREQNIKRQAQITDELNEIQNKLENPQTPEERDPNYRNVVLMTQQDALLRELKRLLNEMN